MYQLTKILSCSAVVLMMTACTTDFTSSTSSTLDTVTPDVTLNDFVTKRYVAIRNEAAKGGGENIDALAQLMGERDSRILAHKMKINFNDIFVNVKDPVDIIAKIESQNSYVKG